MDHKHLSADREQALLRAVLTHIEEAKRLMDDGVYAGVLPYHLPRQAQCIKDDVAKRLQEVTQ